MTVTLLISSEHVAKLQAGPLYATASILVHLWQSVVVTFATLTESCVLVYSKADYHLENHFKELMIVFFFFGLNK